MDSHQQVIVKLIWDIADLLRGDYRPREYVDVILPLVVLRRLDQAMGDQRKVVWETYERLQKRVVSLLCVDGLWSNHRHQPFFNSPDMVGESGCHGR